MYNETYGEKMNQLEEDLERIIKAKNADLGLFILAMHSLMERCLCEKYSDGVYDTENTFGTLINRYTNDFYNSHGKPIYKGAEKLRLSDEDWKIHKTLNTIYKNHSLANDVRHRFETKTPEEAQTTVNCFLAFAKAENWGRLQALEEIKRELENWDSRSPYQSPELTKAIKEIEQLKKENENLAEKANSLSELQNQLKVLTSKENLLKTELEEKQNKLSKKDAKLDEMRKTSFEKMQKLQKEKNEILEQLKDFETTKKYLSYLEKIAFYTKTRHDYESSVIKLTSEQQDVLQQINMNKDFLVKGSAGTGKSLVLLKTLEKAINTLKSELDFDSVENHFRLLTYTKSLVKYNQYVTKILGADVPEETITTADSFLVSMLKRFFPEKNITYKFENSFESLFECEKFTALEVFTECQEFIWANCISKKDYVEKVCDRTGMKKPIKKEERLFLWETLENAEKKLEEQKMWPRNFAAKRIIEAMEQAIKNEETDFCAEYSFVDEAQDLPPVILALIKKSTKRAVFLAGDSDQSIYRKGFNWNLSGIDIRGRSKILKTNFRNTNQIHEFAENYRKKFKNMDQSTQPLSFRPGPPVEISTGKNTDDLMNQIVQQVKMLLNALNYDEENICIITNQKQKLEKIQKLLDTNLGVKSFQILDDQFDFAETKGIRLCTMQNCKGLDFPVVLFLADHRVQGMEQYSAFDSETYYEQQYNMVYVCLTRAMEMLHIFTVPTSEFKPFKDLNLQ